MCSALLVPPPTDGSRVKGKQIWVGSLGRIDGRSQFFLCLTSLCMWRTPRCSGLDTYPRRHFADAPLRRGCGRHGAVRYLPGSVPASTDVASQTRVGGERSHRCIFRVGHAGKYDEETAVTMCLFVWCQVVQETEFCVEEWGNGAGTDNGNSALVEASTRALRRWDARLTLAVWRATTARATGPCVRVAKNGGSRRNGAALSRRRRCSRLRLSSTTTVSA